MGTIFKSRKFWAAVVALALSIFGNRAGVSDQAITEAVYALIAYILGTGLEDGLRARA